MTLSVVLTLQPVCAYANPVGGVVSAGQATITQSGTTLDINQASNKAVIDWRGFDIAPNETTQFLQPSSNAVALNRVNSNTPSQIQGALLANGDIIILNQNGVMFGASSKIDVNGLIATTAGISNDAFMNATGPMYFNIPGNPDARIVNNGTITATQAGLVGLVAPNVVNNGTITAKMGRVQLASGDTATIDLYGDNLMQVAVSDEVKSQLIANNGLIEAPGGKVALTAAAGGEIINSLITVPGEIYTPAVAEHNGEIIIYAEGSNAVANNVAPNKGQVSGTSTVEVSGTLDASGKQAGQTGGNITVTGDHVGIMSGANIDASGDAGGGTVQIGGDFHGQGTTPTAEATIIQQGATINADAITTGNGGNVTVWADDYTNFAGNISAKGGTNSGNGGFIETSGHTLDFSGTGSAAAPNGTAGIWLMDPNNVTINASATSNPNPFTATWTSTGTSNVLYSDIQGFLNSGTAVTITASGSITVAHTITTAPTADTTLDLEAGTDIVVNSTDTITASSHKLNLILDADTAAGGGAISVAANITTNGGNITMGGGGSLPTAGTLNANGTVNIAATGFAVGDATHSNGIEIDAATVNAGSGAIIMNGKGYSGGGGGVVIDLNAVVEASGNGTVNISGTGGGGTGYQHGILISDPSTMVSTQNGDLTIIGQGGTSGATGGASMGMWIGDAGNGGGATIESTGTGRVLVNATGGGKSGSNADDGIYLNGGNIESTASGGGIVVLNGTGGGGSGGGEIGVVMNSGSTVTSKDGNVTINGTGGNDSGGGDTGVWIYGGTVQSSGNSNISITGNGGNNASDSGGSDYGVYISGGTVESTVATGNATKGTISINGTGGGTGSTTYGNTGVVIDSNGSVTSVDGNISLTGTSSNASRAYNDGIDVVQGSISATGIASISLTGTGGSGNYLYDFGIEIGDSAASTISAKSGSITIQGSGGGSGTAYDNYGFYLLNGSAISTTSGAISITGIDGSGSGGSNYGFFTDGTAGNKIGTAGGGGTSGNITLQMDDYSLGTLAVNTTGTVIFEPYHTNTTVGVNNAGSALNITTGANTLIGDITGASLLVIGNTADTGLLTASTTTPGFNTQYISGSGGITISGTQTMAAHNLTLQTDGTLTIGAALTSTGTGTLTIEPATASNGINVDAAASAGNICITSTDLGHITSQGWANFTIGRSDETGTITVPAFTFATTGVTTFLTGLSGSTSVTGTATGSGTTSFVFNSPTTLGYAGTDVTTANQAITFDDAVTLGANATINAGSGTTMFDSTVNGGNALTVTDSSGAVVFDAAVGGSTPLSSVTTTGATTLDGNVTTTGAQLYNNAVTLGGNDTLTTTNSNVTFSSTVDGTSSGSQSLTVNDGTATADFTGKVGGTTPLHNLSITSDNLTLGNKVYGTGALTIQPSTAATAMHINDGTSSGLYLTSAEQGYIQSDWAGITFGSTSDTGKMTIGTSTWSSPLTFDNGSGAIEFAGAQTLGAKSLTADSGSGNIQLDSGATITSTATSGYPIVLAAGGNFVNNSGSSSPLSTGAGGSWAVYSTAAADDTNGAGVMNPATTVYSTTYPTTTGESGNTWFYSSSLDNLGTITITASGQTVTYGTAPNTTPILSTTYTCSGSGSACSDISGLPGLSTSGSVTKSISGNYIVGTWTNDIIAALGSLGFDSGYTGTFSFVSGTLSVLAKALSITGVTANNKTYDTGTTATLNTGSAALSGVVSGDTVTLGTGSASGTFASPNVANGITVDTSGFSISGADSGNYTLTQPSTTANITPAGLTVTASNVSGTYGTSAANTLNGTTRFSETGLLGGQTIGSVTLTTNATTSTSGNYNANTGSNPASWTITPSAATGGTFNANNYSITYDTGTQTITPAALTITGMTASNKLYDTTTAATLNNGSDALSGVVAGHNNGGGTSDVVTLGTGSASGTFASPNVANGITVNTSGFTISGADAGNYTLTDPTTTANITPADLTVTASNVSGTYGTSAANTLNGTTGFSETGLLGGQTIGSVTLATNATSSTSGNYNANTSSNPASWTITPSAATGGTFNANNYSITYDTGTQTITPAALTITGMTASNKVYDTTTTATLNNGSDALNGVVAGHNNSGGTSDVVTLGTGSASGTFASPNVANGITVNTSGFSISGADAGNYALTNPTTTANITPASLTVTASNISGAYGTSAANTLNGTTGFSESGLLGGQTIGSVTLATNATTSTSGNDNAGSWTIAPSSATGGTFNANNYSITYDTGTQTIAKAALTISGMTANNKVYDTTTTATLNNGSDALNGVVAGHNNSGGTSDVVTLGTGSASGTFASPNVANGITVNTSGFSISGADAGNYALTNPTTTANITPAGLTITASNVSGTYGTSAANTLNGTTGFSEAGLLGGQTIGSVTLATNATTSTSANDNAGSWTITPSAATGGTFNANNYSITYDTGTQTIAKAALTISGMTASNKTYDGTTTATVNNSGDSLSGTVAGLNNGGGTSDAVSLTGTGNISGTFSQANVGNNLTVTVTGLGISGTDAGNYSVSQPTATANITAASSPPAVPPTVTNPPVITPPAPVTPPDTPVVPPAPVTPPDTPPAPPSAPPAPPSAPPAPPSAPPAAPSTPPVAPSAPPVLPKTPALPSVIPSLLPNALPGALNAQGMPSDGSDTNVYGVNSATGMAISTSNVPSLVHKDIYQQHEEFVSSPEGHAIVAVEEELDTLENPVSKPIRQLKRIVAPGIFTVSALSIVHMLLFSRSLYFAFASMGMASLRKKLDPARLIDYWDTEHSATYEGDQKLEGMFG